MDRAEKLEKLRDAMAEKGLDGYLVPRGDDYMNEFPPTHAERLRWLTGFTGSAGLACVLSDKATVMSDGRYLLQLKDQLDASLFAHDDYTKASIGGWIKRHVQGGVIGFDPWLHTPQAIERIREALSDSNVSLEPFAENLIDAIWDDQPEPPVSAVSIFPEEVAGLSAKDKIQAVAQVLQKEKANVSVICAPDSVAWLLNIRGTDTTYTPLALSRLIVYSDGQAQWLMDENRLDVDLKSHLPDIIKLYDPNRIDDLWAQFKDKKVLLDDRYSPYAIDSALRENGAQMAYEKDPSILPKALKTPSEIEAMRQSHIADGVAVSLFLKWVAEEGAGKTEMDMDAKLQELRGKHPAHQHPSFPTISGFGAHGAIIHYRADENTNATLEQGGLLLVDSGGQYAGMHDGKDVYGTTDITRTIAIGEPSHEMKESFTRVLKGMIALSLARFPDGTNGAQLDTLARAPLWQVGLDYAHGTGHGVGCYLSVHEEAASLSNRGSEPLKPGMIVSNEPGYYKEGAYGIRCENLICVRKEGKCDDTGKDMLGFETITLAPFDRALILADMLAPEELDWLNDYHARVFEMLSPYLDNAGNAWLKEACASL